MPRILVRGLGPDIKHMKLFNILGGSKTPGSVHTGAYRSSDYRDTASHNQRRTDAEHIDRFIAVMKLKSTQEIKACIARMEDEVVIRERHWAEQAEQQRKDTIDRLKQNLIKQGQRLELAFQEVIDTLKEIDQQGGEATAEVKLDRDTIKSVRSGTANTTTFTLKAPAAPRGTQGVTEHNTDQKISFRAMLTAAHAHRRTGSHCPGAGPA